MITSASEILFNASMYGLTVSGSINIRLIFPLCSVISASPFTILPSSNSAHNVISSVVKGIASPFIFSIFPSSTTASPKSPYILVKAAIIRLPRL